MRKLLFAGVLLLLPALAQAQLIQDRPIVSAERLQLGAGINHEWFHGSEDIPLPHVEKEFTLGLYGAYNMVPALDIVAFSKRGLDSKLWNSAIGLRVTFFAGGE